MAEEVIAVVNTESIDVLAPPAEIRISVGVGAAGTRGSLFYSGTTSPTTFFSSLGIVPNVYDLYFNTSTMIMYQYLSSVSGTAWSALFNMTNLINATIASEVESQVASALNSMFNITSPTAGQTLEYNDVSGRWENV